MHPALCDMTWQQPRPHVSGEYDGLSRRQAVRALLRADRRARARVRLEVRRQKTCATRYAWLRDAIAWLRGLCVVLLVLALPAPLVADGEERDIGGRRFNCHERSDGGTYCVEIRACDWSYPFTAVIDWWNGDCE